MTTYALDTNIVSYYLRKSRNNIIDKRIDAEIHLENKIVIPNVVYYEIRRGLLSVFSPIKTKLFNQFCTTFKVGLMDCKTSEIAASIYAKLKKLGSAVEDADIFIAAFCLQNDYTLVTNNVRHFENIDTLKIVNWIE
ncbi:twitching motility protein PilT [Spirochaetia bacterium]|nr:twitching motility protein PilT [Spirochaetia bacterium]